MTTNYIKCPKCDLNYIKAGEEYCKACDPDRKGKLLSDAASEYEAYKQKKREQYKKNRESMKEYYALRYNRKPER